jgi:hypothetical protein
LEAGGEAGLELAETNVVEARGVDVVRSHAAAGAAANLQRATYSPVGMRGVVYRYENLSIHATRFQREIDSRTPDPTPHPSCEAPI